MNSLHVYINLQPCVQNLCANGPIRPHIYRWHACGSQKCSENHVIVPRAPKSCPSRVVVNPNFIDYSWYREPSAANTTCSDTKKEVYAMCLRIDVSLVTNETSALSLWQMVNVRISVTSLTGAGSNNGGSSLASNDNDCVWHWSRLWLRAERRTIADRAEERSYTAEYLRLHFTILILSFIPLSSAPLLSWNLLVVLHPNRLKWGEFSQVRHEGRVQTGV